MRILMINKFLYPNGGSETYIFKLGNYLKSQGHEVQYFGMEHEGRCVGKRCECIHIDMDFHGGLQAGEADLSSEDHLFLRGTEETAACAG